MKKISISIIIAVLSISVFSPFVRVKAIAGKTSALLVWKCGDNLCKHLFDDTLDTVDANGDYVPNNIAVSLVDDDVDGTKVFDPKNRQPDENYLWVIPTDANKTTVAGLTTWAELETLVSGFDEDEMHAFAYDPCGAVNGKNSISTNGDRQFRATIYDDATYYGVTLADKYSTLTYMPFFWDMGFFNPASDISGTTLENPAVIESYLLEPNVTISSDGIAGAITKVEVASSISEKAVTITKVADGKFKIQFNSSYYDNVIFKITSGTKEYYVRIVRVVYSNKFNGHRILVPKADTNTYDLIAHYTMKDGSEYVFKMEKEFDLTDDPLAEIDKFAGKNLHGANYKIPEEYKDKVVISPTAKNPAVAVSYTVVKAGSTSDVYAGTFAGSGNGFSYTIENGVREVANYGK